MASNALTENRILFEQRAVHISSFTPGFSVEKRQKSTILQIRQPQIQFSQIILAPETINAGTKAIKSLIPTRNSFSILSWQKRIAGLGDINTMAAMMLQPSPWMEDPQMKDQHLLICREKNHFQVAGEIIARHMGKQDGTVLRSAFNTIDTDHDSIKSQPRHAKTPYILRFLLSCEGRGAATIALLKEGDRGLVFDLATNPEMQGRGYATSLINIIIRTAMNKGIWRLHLQAPETKMSFYEKHGFKAIGKVFETISWKENSHRKRKR